MKKLLIALCLMMGFAGIAVAQEPAKKVAPKSTKLEKAKPAAAATTHPPRRVAGAQPAADDSAGVAGSRVAVP